MTLHDEWLYCGAEHYYPVLAKDEKFRTGYRFFSKDVKGFNWNCVVWRIKLHALKRRNDLIFTVPSSWMLERANKSKILRGKRIELLPNPIEINVFSPLSDVEAFTVKGDLGFSCERRIIIVGAVDGGKNFLKGFSLLEEALLKLEPSNIQIVSFGGSYVGESEYAGFPIQYVGKINDIKKLRSLYSIADFAIVPSYVESFGQVAAEALSCETPVIAFRCSGIQDLVIHEVNGFLADPYNTDSLADCIKTMLDLPPSERRILGANGRKHVEEKFSADVIRNKYMNIVKSVPIYAD